MKIHISIFIIILLPVAATAGLIANHTSVAEFNNITPQQAANVRATNILFSHRSVGRTILFGLEQLGIMNGMFAFEFIPPASNWSDDVTRTDYLNYGPLFGHQNQSALTEFFDFASQNDDIIVIGIIKRCYEDMYGGQTASSLFAQYKLDVANYKAQNHNMYLVHSTMPLKNTTDALNAERSKYRDLLLAEYSSAEDGIFDIAAIESWYNGSFTTFEYQGGTYLKMQDSYTTDGGHPNAIGVELLIKALWVLMSHYVNDQPLPVFVMQFKGTASKNKVMLEWTTASEVENLGFNLYRSMDKSDWTLIADCSRIPGLVYSATGQSYCFTDEFHQSTSGVYYYRLESVSLTGEKVFEAEIKIAGDKYVSAYPNPFNNSIKFSTFGITGQIMYIYNISGQEVEHIHRMGSDFIWNAECSGSGCFFYRIGDYKGKIVKIK